MPSKIEAGVEGTPIHPTFPKIDERVLEREIKRYEDNPSKFVMDTVVEMEKAGDGDLIDLLEEGIDRAGGTAGQVIKVSLITWSALHKVGPQLPSATERGNAYWRAEPPSPTNPAYGRENPLLMDWIRRASRTPGNSSSVRDAAMTVYARKRTAYNLDKNEANKRIKAQR